MLSLCLMGGAEERSGASQEVAEPHGAGVLLLALQLTRPSASPFRLAAALAACRDLLVALSVHARLSVPPFPHCCWSLIHSAGPICSAPPLSFHLLILFSPPFLPCAFYLVFLSHFFLLLCSYLPPFTPFLGLLSPQLFSPFVILLYGEFLVSFTLRHHSWLPMLQGNINYLSFK